MFDESQRLESWRFRTMDYLSWFFGGTTVVGLLFTIYYGRKSSHLEADRKKIEWADIQSCANDLGAEIKRSFSPDAILTPGLRGATFTNLLAEKFGGAVPVLVGVESWKADVGAFSTLPSFITIETSKWYVHIPGCLLDFKERNLLIIDDFAMSGDFLERLKNLLISNGFAPGNIKTACIAATNVAVHSNKGPDYSWMKTPDDSFYFPWGKAK
jgi:hypoxanthine phosphoribosyltransferase